MAEQSALKNGVKAASEALILPGSSLIMDGEVKQGLLHALGGVAARAVVGPIGWLYVAANSFSNSVSEKHLHEHFIAKKG